MKKINFSPLDSKPRFGLPGVLPVEGYMQEQSYSNSFVHKQVKMSFTVDRVIKKHPEENRLIYPKGFPHLYLKVMPQNPHIHTAEVEGITQYARSVVIKAQMSYSYYDV